MSSQSDFSVKKVSISTEVTIHEIKPDNAHGKIAKGLNDLVAHTNTAEKASDAGTGIDSVVNPVLTNMPNLHPLPDQQDPVHASKEIPDKAKSMSRRASQVFERRTSKSSITRPNVNNAPVTSSSQAPKGESKVNVSMTEPSGLTLEQLKDLGKIPTAKTNTSLLEKAGNLFGAFKKNDNLSVAEQGINLINAGAGGKKISPSEYVKTAEKMLNDPATKNSEDYTIIHQLYEKAAEGYMQAGKTNEAFQTRAASANAVQFSKDHPLHNMTEGIEAGISKQVIRDVGLHMESGSSKFPEGIAFATRPHADGTNRNVLFGQLSTASREEFQGKLEHIFGTYQKDTKEFSGSNLEAFEKSLPEHLKPVKISCRDGYKEPFRFPGKDENGNFTASTSKGLSIQTSTYEIEFANGGKLIIGAAPLYKTIYETVQLEVPANQKDGDELKQMQQILTVLGLGPVMGKQLKQDDERLMLGAMLKAHFPQAWDAIQLDKNYHDYSPAQLRQKMIKLEPGMKEKFEMYENNPHLVGKRQIFPGKELYALGDISQGMEKAGILGFFTGTGVKGAVAFLNSGILSSDLKKRAMINSAAGGSEEEDMITGGSSSVFLRSFNDKLTNVPISSKKFDFSNDYQVIYKTESINVGGVCYHGDQFGIRNPHYDKNGKKYETYAYRQSAIDFAKNLDNSIDKFPVNDPLSAIGTYYYKTYEGKDVVNKEGKVIISRGDVLYNGPPEEMPNNAETHVIGKVTYHILRDPRGGASNEVTIDGGNISPQFVSKILTGTEAKKQILLREMDAIGMLSDIENDGNGIITNATVTYNNGPGQNAIRASIHDMVVVGDFLPGR